MRSNFDNIFFVLVDERKSGAIMGLLTKRHLIDDDELILNVAE